MFRCIKLRCCTARFRFYAVSMILSVSVCKHFFVNKLSTEVMSRFLWIFSERWDMTQVPIGYILVASRAGSRNLFNWPLRLIIFLSHFCDHMHRDLILFVFCTPLCRHLPQRRSTTILGVVHTRVHCPNTSLTCLTAILSHGWQLLSFNSSFYHIRTFTHYM